MTKTTNVLNKIRDNLFLTDGGIETTLIYHDELDLPHFAAFDLLQSASNRNILRNYYRRYARIAHAHKTGFIFESATWRASADWGQLLGYTIDALANANRAAILLMEEVQAEFPTIESCISGCVGPRGDGYNPAELMTAAQAEAYHCEQIQTFATTRAQLITAVTMTNTPEAIGIANAAHVACLPVVISFTVETDGRLPTGELLEHAIAEVDQKARTAPAYYMINCAHPDHYQHLLERTAPWHNRIGGMRANASRCSHAELDAATELDAGDPNELASSYALMRSMLPRLNVLGGCCGTDHRHIEAMIEACGATAN